MNVKIKGKMYSNMTMYDVSLSLAKFAVATFVSTTSVSPLPK